ncbi:MAG: hypothetical protein ACP5E2_06235 [Terracidiphilus sp.]
MVVVPLSDAARDAGATSAGGADSSRWVGMIAAGTLAASGALLVTGKRRAGLAAAIAGAALAMLDQQEVVRQWWNALPAYLEEVQGMLNHAQAAVEDLSVQGEKLRRVLSR